MIPGSHGGFDRISELNDRMAASIEAQATPVLRAGGRP
jgi:hypothetical protein